MAKRQQLQIVGTERDSDPEIDRAAEAFRKARDERMELSVTEKETKVIMVDVIDRKIKAGTLQLDRDGKFHNVYSYEDDDGQTQHVQVKADKIKIRVRASKEDGDDGTPEDNQD
jgi:hypothetical protein